MAENQEKIQELFQKRISIVEEISALNAEQLKNSQQLLGNGIELQRCSERLDEQGDTGPLRAERANAEAQEEELQNTIADCDDRLKKLEAQIVELDQKLNEL